MMKRLIVFAVLCFSHLLDAQNLPAGPLLGHVSLRGANIWLQSPENGTVSISYWPKDQSNNTQTLSASVDEAYGNIHTFKLSGLEPATTYQYKFSINGKNPQSEQIYNFTTQTLWQWRTDPPDFSVLAGSCNYENETVYDRPGKPYGSEHEIFKQMATEDADVMLWLGDNWYYREVDFDAEQNLVLRVLRDRQQPHLQDIFSRYVNYATWDDHDFGPNNSGSEFIFKSKALDIFKKFWANPSYGMPEQAGVYTKVAYNDIEFFMLDNRFNKSPEHAKDGPDKTFYGPAQLTWLKNSLLNSKAPFKIIVGGTQMLNDYHTSDGWDKYRYERDPFLQWLDDNKITGVVFFSGDKHHTEMLRADRPGAYPLYEMTCSPFTSGTHSANAKGNLENPRLVTGSMVNEHNYCKFSFSGPRTDRRMNIKVIGKNGQQYWNKQIKSSVLTYSQIP